MGERNPGAVRELRMSVEHRPGAVLVRLSGSATMEHAERLRERMLGLPCGPQARIVLDLSDLDFVNSVGLGAFVTAHVRCKRQGGSLRVVDPPPAIRELLDLTRLTALFEVYPTVEEALAGGGT